MKINTIIENLIENTLRRFKVKNANQIEITYQTTPFGFDSIPVNGSKAYVIDHSTYNMTIGYIQKAVTELNVGETIVFSKNSSGEVVSKIIHRSNDSLELLGTGNYLVKFNELKDEFNKLKDWCKDHTHTSVASTDIPPTAPLMAGSIPVVGTIPAPLIPPITNIDSCKASSLKTL